MGKYRLIAWMGARPVRTRILIYMGLAGFVAGTALLFNNRFYFHDIQFEPSKIVIKLLDDRREALYDRLTVKGDTAILIDQGLKKIQVLDDKDVKPPVRILAFRVSPVVPDSVRRELLLAKWYNSVKREIRRVEYSADTSFSGRYFVAALFGDKDSLATIYDPERIGAIPDSFHFEYIRDTSAYIFSLPSGANFHLTDSSYRSRPIAFFVKYPDFGIWSLLMIFEFVACLIVIPVSIATVQEIKDDFPDYVSSGWVAVWDFVLSGVLVAIFALVLDFVLNRPPLVGDQFFMHGYSTLTGWYTLVANLAAIATLAGFLFTGRILGQMLEDIRPKANAHQVNLLKSYAITATPGIAVGVAPLDLSTLRTSIDKSATDLADLKNKYTEIRKFFTVFFFTSSFLLSMVVLQNGALFSGIRSLDLVKFLDAPPVRFILRPDFVYLLGGIYSILLLIFYIPVKISIMNLENKLPDLNTPGVDNSGLLANIGGGLKTLLGVLAASSPLLISLVQYIASTLGGK